MKKTILLFLCFVFSFQITKSQPLHYFFDKKNNTKEIICFTPTPLGTDITQKAPNATKWTNLKILKSPPKIGAPGGYVVEFADKSKHLITPEYTGRRPLKIKNLKTNITRTFEMKTLYLLRGDETEYLEYENSDNTGKLLDKAIWIWKSKGSTKTFKTVTFDYQNDISTLSLPNEKGTYTLKSVVNDIESVNSYELTTPSGEKKIFYLEAVKYE